MTGDFSRWRGPNAKHRSYSGVLMQQGRLYTDSDWNENTAIQTERMESALARVIGPGGTPKAAPGFAITAGAGGPGGPGQAVLDPGDPQRGGDHGQRPGAVLVHLGVHPTPGPRRFPHGPRGLGVGGVGVVGVGELGDLPLQRGVERPVLPRPGAHRPLGGQPFRDARVRVVPAHHRRHVHRVRDRQPPMVS